MNLYSYSMAAINGSANSKGVRTSWACVCVCGEWVFLWVFETTQKHRRLVRVYCLSNATANGTGMGNM